MCKIWTENMVNEMKQKNGNFFNVDNKFDVRNTVFFESL